MFGSASNPTSVLFKATTKETPALHAGNVQPHKFIHPPTRKQARVANILSGNYCQPKCAEPWVEVKFEDEKEGKIQVVASANDKQWPTSKAILKAMLDSSGA